MITYIHSGIVRHKNTGGTTMKTGLFMSARALNLKGYTRDQVFDELSLNYIDYGWNSTMILASTKWGISRSEFKIPSTDEECSIFESHRFDCLRAIVNKAFDLWEAGI